jgi:stage III sporulation protein AG
LEFTQLKERIYSFIKQNKYVLVIAVIGVLLLLPETEGKVEAVVHEPEAPTLSIEQQLSKLLSTMDGAGKVEVLLTQAVGEEIVYQKDMNESISHNGTDSEVSTVIVSGSDRSETGLICKVNPPIYLGAVILCQGGNDPSVRLAIVEAVSRATGLGADKISVLKME